ATMAHKTIKDPILGVLRFEEEHGDCAYYRGEVELTPKHRIVIEFEHVHFADNPISLAEGLAVARPAYERVRLDERTYRLATATAFLDNVVDVDDFFGEPGWTA